MLSKFIHDIKDESFEIFDIQSFRVGYFCSRDHLKTDSQENEDCLFLKELSNGLTFGVADGAGGHPRGRDASYSIGESFLEYDGLSPINFISILNQKIISLKVGAKSTLSFAIIKDDLIRYHSVGDSEILHWNAQGTLLYNSIPHSTVGHMIKAGSISQERSLNVPERYYVDHLMGDDYVHIDSTTEIEMKKGHTILIGSDGIFDNVPHSRLAELAASGVFENSFQELIEICRIQKDWIKNDDLSFIVLRKIKA